MEREYSGDNIKFYNHGGFIQMDIKKIEIPETELGKIHSAWCEGRPVVMGYKVEVGKKGLVIRISIFNVDTCCFIHPNAINITREWMQIKPLLENNQIPQDWMDKIIKKIEEVMKNGKKSCRATGN